MFISFFRLGLLLFLLPLVAEAQVLTHSVVLDWQEELHTFEPIEGWRLKRLQFAGAQYDNQQPSIPIYAHQVELPSYGELQVQLVNPQYAPLTNVEDIELPAATAPEIEAQVALRRRQPVGLVSFVPIRKNPTSGQYEKLLRAELQIRIRPQSMPVLGQARNFTTTSKLASGTIYKIAVTNTGVQKLDYNFLQSLGIDVDNIDPRTIQLLGQPGAALTERMNVPIPDDLLENHIFVAGEQDGSFDANDYILFYGVSPTTWSYDDALFALTSIPTPMRVITTLK